MSLPPIISEYIFKLDGSLRRSLCIAFGDDFLVREWWGPVDSLDHPVKEGSDVREVIPALFGLELGQELRLEFIGLGENLVFDLHLFNQRDSHYVLLIPANEAEAKTIELQQVANEVRLLNEKQTRLVNELEKAQIELEEKRQLADRASMVKSRFIASMSHEFRTPLTSVIGYTELLQSDADESSDVAAHSSAIKRSAHHLLSMVDNILDQSRIEEGNVAIHIGDLDIRRVTDDIASMMAPLAAEKLLAFAAFVDTKVPSHIRTDEVRLRQILVNLVGNAIKFTDHGEVKLEMSWANDVLTFSVADTGPGIPEDQRVRIFEAFHRIEGHDTGKRGTGLGLNIAARLVELLNGRIDVFSEPGNGSMFVVEMAAPRATDEVGSRIGLNKGNTDIASSSSGQTILVAEDDPDLIELLSLFLARGGYKLILATDGQEAIDVAIESKPDLVLMDVNMPKLDGLSAVRVLRSRGFEKPVVALTASLSANDRDQAFSWGCDGYLVKPISMPELLSAVGRYLEEAAK